MQMQIQILTYFFELTSKSLRLKHENVEILQLWANYDFDASPKHLRDWKFHARSNFEYLKCKRNYHNPTENGSFRGMLRLKKITLVYRNAGGEKIYFPNLFFNRFSRDIYFFS